MLKNGRHERFAQNLASGMPKLEAFRAAGFAGGGPAATKVYNRPEVRARISEILGRAAKRVEISRARVLEELAKVGFANMADYMRVGSDGDPYLDFSALSRDQAAALVEVIVEDFKEGRGKDARDVRRVKFKLGDKRAALVDIAKMEGWWTERHEHSGKDGGPIEISDGDIARRIAFLLAKSDPARPGNGASPQATKH